MKNTRRGVLLLVILALLAMFGMVAVTFVVVASQARIAAEAHQRLDEVTDPPEKLLNSALMQVLTGSTNPASAIGPHSLLEDVYGNNTYPLPGQPAATATSVDQRLGTELLHVNLPFTVSEALRRVGCVFTVEGPADSPMAGHSTRIVAVQEDPPDSGTYVFELLPFDGVETADALLALTNYPCEYRISGAPFSGTGFGDWDVATSTMSNLGLQPGLVTAQAAAAGNTCLGANEDYDAPDYQNMILGAQIPGADGSVLQTIPSLHRPELAHYWESQGSTPEESVQYILRPTKYLHTNFSGGNVNSALPLGFDPINGPWDVDNDGDGIPDSIWVDLGFPARSSPDGRLVKPLFAILCIDLDGRLNLNAHGSLAQTTDAYYSNPTPSTDDGQAFAAASSSLVRGLGYGPAEVNLGSLFATTAEYQTLMTGTYGRYGTNQVPGMPGSDPLAVLRWFDYDYANGYFNSTNHVYGTPPDLYGTIAMGLDLAGRPVWDRNLSGQEGENNPYEMNALRRVSRGTADGVDAAFSATELERLLRIFDRDAATLPPRLLQIAGGRLAARRHEVTTDSVDVPAASVAGRVPERTPRFVDLLTARSVPEEHWADLFDPDLLAGRKMNLNRPLPSMLPAPGETNALEARQLLARHLFCLAMLLRNTSYNFPWPADANLTGKEGLLTTHRIAQWAVNVVDFLDDDSIMTPFQYVEDPFAAGWTAPVDVPTTTDNLVWGMERPPLQLTETLAFHDRRVADLAWSAGGETAENYRRQDKEPGSDPPVPADDTLDQPRIPQGSLFVELYCTSEPGANRSDDLYFQDGGEWLLDVSKRAGSTNRPVWRLAITKPADSGVNNDLSQRLRNAPATFSLESEPQTQPSASLLPGLTVADNIEIERTVSFVPQVMPGAVYYNRNGDGGGDPNVRLAPGEYLLVGPRKTTVVGSVEGEWPPGPSPQVISLDPASVTTLGGTSYPQQGTDIKAVKTMVAAARWPGNETHPIGVSVSEPVPGKYYDPLPTHSGSDGVKEWYGDPETGPFLDIPLDSRPNMPLYDDDKLDTRTHQAYRYVLLQRLADPTRAYHQVNNPYRTIDWMPIDLTVFNGQDKRPHPWPPDWAYDTDGTQIWNGPWDPDDDDPEGAQSRIQFDTRERGDPDRPDERNLWAQGVFSTPEDTSAIGSSSAYFAHSLLHSLGFLNRTFGSPGGEAGIHLGDPESPFPWLTWNNRPFVNAYELLMVPATTAARFGWEHTVMATGAVPTGPYSADPDPGGADPAKYVYNPSQVGFVHLMNLFHSGTNALELHRIFDFLEVPSRFAGAQAYAANAPANEHFVPQYRDPPSDKQLLPLDARFLVGPNLVPTYREPGKVNLNTIFSERVFQGLMNGFQEGDATTLWNNFLLSRRGHTASVHPLLFDPAADPPMPTRFARPFRSAAGHALRPMVAQPTLGEINREIESTLLRSNPNPGSEQTPLFAFPSNDDVNDTARNPYFHHQGLMRLGNLVTTRSNVYAVWITVGFFEVTALDTYDPVVYPDGLQLGYELGADTGEIRRHRAFYIIDRSVPVGFVRGQDGNAEKTVLLQRFIE